MEQKELRIAEANENAILGQLATFGWTLVGKKKDKPLLWLKTNRYTFEREEREESPFEKQKEEEWNRLFHEWNDLFLFKKWPWTVLVNFLAFLLVIAGIVLYIVSNFVPDPMPLVLIGCLLLILGLIGSIVNLSLMSKQLGRIKKLDGIAREVRDARLLERKDAPSLGKDPEAGKPTADQDAKSE